MSLSIQSIEEPEPDDASPSRSTGRSLEGARAIWEVLVEEGVEVVFGYPGGAIMPAYDVMPEYPIRHVLVRHEQSAAHMADGYARASGEVGVAIATSGPGATNLVTGIATAMLDSIPMVCITGQVPSHLIGSDAFQETDVSGVTLPVTKYNYLVTKAEDVAPTLRQAFALARSGRQGPVLVDITKDAQVTTAEFEARPRRSIVEPVDSGLVLRAERLEEARHMMRCACRPLILAGHGIIKSGASPDLLELVERTQIPVASTLLGLGGFPASHPLHLGMLGMHGETWVNNAVQESDLIIALGMRFDDRVTGKPATFAAKAKKIHVEIDAAEINKNVKVDLAIHGDVRQAIQEWNAQLRQDGSTGISLRRRDWHRRIAEARQEALSRDIVRQPDGGRLWAAQVVNDLWRITEGRALLATDVGQHQMWAAQYYRHETPRSLFTSGGLGTMGYALPSAIGARLARPEEEIWVVAGDGGFQMTAPELSTLLQEKLKLNIAIINNQYLGMVRQWQEMFFDGRIVATPISGPDFVKLAEAHGHEGIRVTRRSEVEPAIRRAREADHSVVVEFRVEPEDIVYPIVPAGKAIHEMIRRPPAE
jgi:acetolactate synthase-1/2/3 large subunit